MRRQYYATGDAQFHSQGVKIIYTCREGTWAARAVGVAHTKLVDRHDSPLWVGASQEATPQIRPGRVAVHAEESSLPWCDAVVEHMPGPRNPFGVDGLDQPGPGRVHSWHSLKPGSMIGRHDRIVDHQTISAYEVFSPDPMPSNRIRSAARS